MRWMKHMTTTRRDEGIAIFLSEFGLEGYGFWWSLLETVAAGMTKSEPEKCSATYSLGKWATETGCSTRKFVRWVKSLDSIGLISARVSNNFRITLPQSYSKLSQNYLQSSSDVFQIIIPNLLKYRDEYQKKSGQTPDKLRTNSGAKSIDTDTEGETPPQPPQGGLFASSVSSEKSPLTREEKFDASEFFESQFWPAVWMKKGKGKAKESFRRVAKSKTAAEHIMAAAIEQGPMLLDAASRHDREPLMVQTWLNQGRYDDELTPPPPFKPRPNSDDEEF